MIATSGFLTTLECTKFVFGRGSHDAPPYHLVGWGRDTTKVINATRTVWNFQKPAWNVREFYFGGLVGTMVLLDSDFTVLTLVS